MRNRPWVLVLSLSVIVAVAGIASAATNRQPVQVSAPGSTAALDAVEPTLTFPGSHNFAIQASTSLWIQADSLELDVFWPAGAPTNAQVLAHMKDWDLFWFQNLLPGHLEPGQTNRLRIDLSPESDDWKPVGHHGGWHYRCLMDPLEFSVRVFSSSPYTGACEVANVALIMRRPDPSPPYIRRVRANRDTVPCFEKFELTFELPDRYTDPFDQNQIAVSASFELPDGETALVDGFYAIDYYNEPDTSGERVFMQGKPFWRLRFTPPFEGVYKYTISATDRNGTTTWGPSSFKATKSQTKPFVRVSLTDPRRFEYQDGTPFFPIGHNIRSPFDTRMDGQFPWIQRWPEGFSAYKRYFSDTGRHGENIAEVWTASWSLGLEWSSAWYGYHGVGQFNTINAWQLDKVLEEADRNGICVNLVIHNHGKFSTYSDEEWGYNPFNRAQGGYLDSPDEYFTDPRALKSFLKLMRYMIARYGYSTRLFAWELWSELDLTGASRGGGRGNEPNYKRKEVVDWHRRMLKSIKEMDPYDHLVSTHVSGSYNIQNTKIVELPELDFAAVDAYHGNPNAIHIVELLRQTAEFNNKFKKPVLVTEFGGSPMAQGVKHLEETLHAAIWASTCIPIAGTPMFWWWQLIEEEDFYPEFRAVSNFVKNEDLRNPDLLMARPAVTGPGSKALAIQCLKSRANAYGWLYHFSDYSSVDANGPLATTNIAVRLEGMTAGEYQIEFWDTSSGKIAAQSQDKIKGETMDLVIPPFARDIAFKVKKSN